MTQARFARIPRVLVSALLAAAALAPTLPARAIDFKHRLTLGFRYADYLAADKQKGGFRFFGGFRGTGKERKVSIGEVFAPTLSLGYGVAQFKKAQLTVELQASRITSDIGKETVYIDPDASTRIALPPLGGITQTGDETFELYSLGKITMTPVFVNALMHWSGAGSGDRSDFYFGGGPGMVFASIKEDPRYRKFVADLDGHDDVKTGNAFAVMLKTGADLRLTKRHGLYIYFEAEFFSTAFVTSQPQVRWSGANFFAGQRARDTNGDGSLDATFPSDFHLVDPGHMRMDGAMAGIGVRYRFGGHHAAPEASASAGSVPAPS